MPKFLINLIVLNTMEKEDIKNNENDELEKEESLEENDSVELIEEISASELDDFDDSLPPVTESAIEAHKNEEIRQENEREQILSTHADKKDKDGLSFDPNYHSTDKDGNPVLNQDGTLRKKRGKKLGAINSKLSVPNNQNAQPQQTIDYRGPAKVTAQTIDGVLMSFSSDLKPTDEEKSLTELTWEEYYRIKDVRDIPPGIMLLGIYTSRISSRLFDDEKYTDIAKKKQAISKMVKSHVISQKRKGFFAKIFGRKEKDIAEHEKEHEESFVENNTQNRI